MNFCIPLYTSFIGLEQLSGLEELDAGYNCLSSSESVSALCSLGHLVRLCLEFNPISYSKDYRLLVLRRVASSVNKKKVDIMKYGLIVTFRLLCSPTPPVYARWIGAKRT